MPAPATPPAGRSPSVRTASVVAVLGAAAVLVGSWVPSAWADEGATMSGARRTLPELWRMVHEVDGVHGLYYAFLHLWFTVVPYSPFTLRLPSAVAIGVAAGLTVLLTGRLAGRSTALVAGILTCCVPRLTFAGIEGRSSAFSVVTAVGLTLVFVVAVERTTARRRRAWAWWTAYGALAVLAGLLFVYTDLVVIAHAVTVAVWLLRRGRTSMLRAALSFATAAVLAALALVPFVLMVSGQTGQLSWMGPFTLGPELAGRILIGQWFAGTGTWAAVPFVLMALGVVATTGLPRLPSTPRLHDRIGAVEVALPVVVVPTVVVVLVSLLVRPLYDPRYLTFCAPFVAMLVALALTSVPWRWVTLTAVVVLVALVVPIAVGQRGPTAKDGSTWASAADVVATGRRAEAPGTRDGIWYGPLPRHVTRTTEFVAAAYPTAFAGMHDLTLERSAVSTGKLWAERSDVHDPLPPTDTVDRIWFVGARTEDQPALLQRRLAAAGWSVSQKWFTGKFVILKFSR
ncbi:mannosyltransferase [Curtobacterium flaccumfaciens]|uniref:Mannosyltransferase n=1 Tax=Curtobacterium salicis TaxID=1779862 RepID=A0ABX0T9K4_9MICO|nr:glycosyltransferase family 39 protein [Curtobacterium sp. WW7]NII42211.1 mannosyltransferase [Curtobacterium sp. WW7]